ncbi:MAG: TetR/AcrR family transcriptional regulator [Ilumatobacteraceae bacterium]
MGVTLSRGRQLWLRAGQELLRRGGIAAVKLQAMTEELDLTTGSFYHHFSSMAEFVDQLATFYGDDQAVNGLQLADDPDPLIRLRRLHEVSLDERLGPLDAAMRDWAGSNATARAAVEHADRQVLLFIERAFRDLGHPGRAAQIRAHLMFAMGVARIAPPWPSARTEFDEVLTLLAGPVLVRTTAGITSPLAAVRRSTPA